jgi:hypothetical protein
MSMLHERIRASSLNLLTVSYCQIKKEIIMNRSKRALLAGLAATSTFVTQTVLAAVPAGVTTAVGDMATDAAAVATLVLVAIIGVVAIKFIRKGL